MLKIDLIDSVLWNKASVITTDSEELDISNIYKTKKINNQKNNNKKPTKQKKPHPNITTHIHVMVVKAGVGDTYSKILKTYASYPWITENKWECALSLNFKNLFMSIHRQQRTNMQASPKWREIFYSVYGAADVKTNKSKSFASEKDRHLRFHFLLFYNSTVFISVLSVSIAHHSIQSTSRYSHPPNLLKVI